MVFEHDYENYPELTNQQLADFGFSSPHKQLTEDFTAQVVKVHDGDTITVSIEERDFDFPVRLLGIDSPELSEGGEESREWLKQKIDGQEVEVRIDSANRVGKYGRLLGTVYFQGLDVGQEQIHLGLAKPFGEKKEGEVPGSSFWFRDNQWF